ncbi:hypothetical protein WDZ17_08260 [Pseudokineococcus basanitobsidens]|uniref:Uncharacterized protein n=1 Tax=Pseudokineococcus basanitobsidens TaxID=1926649 RepID=A0ABU8RJS2_9ACTN
MSSARTPKATAGTASARSIQRQVSRPAKVPPAPPSAAPAKKASDRSAAKMPSVMASCWKDASRPRMALGEISAM